MPRSRTSTQLQAFRDALAAVDGTGSWTVDLSADGQVLIGRGLPVDGADTCVVLGAWRIQCAPAELASPQFTHRIGIAARRTATADDDETRLLDAADLADNVARALLGAAIGTDNMIDPRVDFEEYEDAASDSAGPVVVVGELTYTTIQHYDDGGL